MVGAQNQGKRLRLGLRGAPDEAGEGDGEPHEDLAEADGGGVADEPAEVDAHEVRRADPEPEYTTTTMEAGVSNELGFGLQKVGG